MFTIETGGGGEVIQGLNTSTRNISLDVVKVFAFAGIVALHTIAPSSVPTTFINVLARIGVPIFFAVSGYFALSAEPKVLGCRAKRIAVIFIVAIMVYFFAAIIGVWGVDPITFFPRFDIAQHLTIDSFLKMIYLNSVPEAYHLWFLLALLGTYLFYVAWSACDWPIGIFFFLASALLVFRFCFSEFRESVEPLSVSLRTWVFFGIPCFALGVAIRKWQTYLIGIPMPLLLLGVGGGVALSWFECVAFGLQELYIGTIITVVCLLVACLKYPTVSGRKKRSLLLTTVACAAYLGKEPIMVAYVVHLLVAHILRVLFAQDASSGVVFFLALVFSLLIGMIFVLAKNGLTHKVKQVLINSRFTQNLRK